MRKTTKSWKITLDLDSPSGALLADLRTRMGSASKAEVARLSLQLIDWWLEEVEGTGRCLVAMGNSKEDVFKLSSSVPERAPRTKREVVELTESSYGRLKELQKRLQDHVSEPVRRRADVVIPALRLLDWAVRMYKEGRKFYIASARGERDRVYVIGLAA